MRMTLEQKIGQLLLVSLDGNTLDAAAEKFLMDTRAGNIIQFGNNVTGFIGARAFNATLTSFIRENCGVAPLIGVDHEGGRVMRFSGGMTWFPSQMALGAANDESLTEQVGRAMGEELRAAGFSLSFSPVVDINVNRKNPVIGARAFGDDPETVTRHGAAMAHGLQSGGVMACLKHFPGHGDTAVDSHYGLPRVDKSREDIERVELRPYRELISMRAADAVMTTHILFPALERENLPATMSRAILTDLLRDDIGFDGLIITDGMQMKAIADHYGVARGCIEAVKAGCDLLCVGSGGAGSMDTQRECFDALLSAARSSDIPMERIDDAVQHVLKAKEKWLMGDAPDAPDFEAHERLNQRVCERAVTALTQLDERMVGRVRCLAGDVREVAFGLTHADPRKASFAQFAKEYLGTDAADDDDDWLLIGLSRVAEDGAELRAARAALEAGKRVAFALTGAPYGADALPKGCPTVCVYALTRQSARAAVAALRGDIPATGTLPVKLS